MSRSNFYDPHTKQIITPEMFEEMKKQAKHMGFKLIRPRDIVVNDEYVIPIEEQTDEDRIKYFPGIYGRYGSKNPEAGINIAKDARKKKEMVERKKDDFDAIVDSIWVKSSTQQQPQQRYVSTQQQPQPKTRNGGTAHMQDTTYSNAKRNSHTEKKQTQKRTRKVNYVRINAVIAAAIVTGTIFTTVKMTNVYDNIHVNSLLRENSEYTNQINGFGEDYNHKINAINKSKRQLQGLDSNDLPLFYYDFDHMISEFFELPDATFLSNIYNYYQNFDYKNGKVNGNGEISNWDYFIIQLSNSVNEQTHPITTGYIKNCNSWDEFLKKNFSFYLTEENNDLQEIFTEIVKSQAEYNNVYLENYIGNNRGR